MIARRSIVTSTPGAISMTTSRSSPETTVPYMPAVVRTRCPGMTWLWVCIALRCRFRCGRMIST